MFNRLLVSVMFVLKRKRAGMCDSKKEAGNNNLSEVEILSNGFIFDRQLVRENARKLIARNPQGCLLELLAGKRLTEPDTDSSKEI